MKNIWSLICEKYSIDSKTNSLSIFNCVEEIRLEIDKAKMPQDDKLVIPLNIQLVSFWSIDDYHKENTSEIKIELIDPQGKLIRSFINILQSKKGNKRLRSIANIQGMPITENGLYHYRVLQKHGNEFKLVSELPLEVNLSYKVLTNISK